MLLNKLKKKQEKNDTIEGNNKDNLLNIILQEIKELKNNQTYIINLLKKLNNNN